jgi:predicted deacylase
MITIIIIIILIIILTCIYFYNIISKMCDNIYPFTYTSPIEGPTILLIGGTHGNEPAGQIALDNLINKLNLKQIVLKKGKLIIVPRINSCGLNLNIRCAPFTDINRNYPIEINGKSDYNINSQVINLVKDSDFIIDFHEGTDFYKINKDGFGSVITPVNNNISINIAQILSDHINLYIDNGLEHFTAINPSEVTNIKGSLRYYVNMLKNKNYVLVETTGQYDKQLIDIRVEQSFLIITKLLKLFDLI